MTTHRKIKSLTSKPGISGDLAAYGEAMLARLSADLTSRYRRGFGMVNLSQMKKCYLLWPVAPIFQTASEKSASAAALAGVAQTLSEFAGQTSV